MAGWRILGLCSALALPVESSRLLSRRQCERKEEPDWSGFQTAIEPSGLAGEDGISNLAADLRTGALSLSVPHTYTIVGGGEWGPRVVAKALLESVYVDWVNDVYLLDMEEAKAYMRPENEFEKAQAWFNEHLCRAIERCPRKAVVVLDNVHLLEGEDIRLLDKMLSLTDGEKSNMDCSDHKVSAERCLFLMLLNEDGLDENRRKSGKERLMDAWEFKGPAFTTTAFVGRIDIAVSLSQKPQLLPAEMKAAWEQARILPTDGWEAKMREKVKAVWEATDRGTLQAIGVVAAATMLAACYKLGCFQTEKPNIEGLGDSAATPKLNSGSNSGGGGGDGKKGKPDRSSSGSSSSSSSRRNKALGARGGGSGGIPIDGRGGGVREGAKFNGESEEDESRSTDGEECHATSAPPTPAPLEASALPVVATTGTVVDSRAGGDGAGETVAARTRSSIGRTNTGSSPLKSARRRRSATIVAANGEGAA